MHHVKKRDLVMPMNFGPLGPILQGLSGEVPEEEQVPRIKENGESEFLALLEGSGVFNKRPLPSKHDISRESTSIEPFKKGRPKDFHMEGDEGKIPEVINELEIVDIVDKNRHPFAKVVPPDLEHESKIGKPADVEEESSWPLLDRVLSLESKTNIENPMVAIRENRLPLNKVLFLRPKTKIDGLTNTDQESILPLDKALSLRSGTKMRSPMSRTQRNGLSSGKIFSIRPRPTMGEKQNVEHYPERYETKGEILPQKNIGGKNLVKASSFLKEDLEMPLENAQKEVVEKGQTSGEQKSGRGKFFPQQEVLNFENLPTSDKSIARDQDTYFMKDMRVRTLLPQRSNHDVVNFTADKVFDNEISLMPKSLGKRKFVPREHISKNSNGIGNILVEDLSQEHEKEMLVLRNERKGGVSPDIRAKNIFLKGERKEIRDVPMSTRRNRDFITDIKAKEYFLRNGDQKMLTDYVDDYDRNVQSKGVSQIGIPQKAVEKSAQSHKILDISDIPASQNTDLIHEIIGRIEMGKLARSGKIDVLVKHDELGRFELSAMVVDNDKIDLNIKTESVQGQKFFYENESELIKNLNRVGVKISDLKILSTNGELLVKGESSSEKGEYHDRNNTQGRSDHFNEDANSRRRRELWEEYKERYANAS